MGRRDQFAGSQLVIVTRPKQNTKIILTTFEIYFFSAHTRHTQIISEINVNDVKRRPVVNWKQQKHDAFVELCASFKIIERKQIHQNDSDVFLSSKRIRGKMWSQLKFETPAVLHKLSDNCCFNLNSKYLKSWQLPYSKFLF